MITRSQGDGHIDRCKGQQCAKWRYFTWSARPLNMFEICSLNLIPQFESRELKEGENPKWEGRRGETLEGLTESRNPTPKSSGSTPLKSIYVFRWHLCFGSKCWQKQVVGGECEMMQTAQMIKASAWLSTASWSLTLFQIMLWCQFVIARKTTIVDEMKQQLQAVNWSPPSYQSNHLKIINL